MIVQYQKQRQKAIGVLALSKYAEIYVQETKANVVNN